AGKRQNFNIEVLRAISLKASAMDRAAQSREGWSHEPVRSPGMAPHPALLQALHHKVAAAIGAKRILRRDNLGIFLPEFFETLQKNLFLSRSRRRNRAGQPRRNPFRKKLFQLDFAREGLVPCQVGEARSRLA